MTYMNIGKRLKEIRERRSLSQAQIEKRSGLLCPYISRVENGHTVPNLDTLERMAKALKIPLYMLFYDGQEPIEFPEVLKRHKGAWGSTGKDLRLLVRFRRLLSRTEKRNQRLLLLLARRMAQMKIALNGNRQSKGGKKLPETRSSLLHRRDRRFCRKPADHRQ
jgi:transcriptional regulator with XRE-family HTH domain